MLFLIGDFLLTGRTHDSRAAELLELAATAFPDADFKADILDASIDVQVRNWKDITKNLLPTPSTHVRREQRPIAGIFE